jgi:hypothetical protein
MALAFLALLATLWAGLLRLGWKLPPLQPTLALAHGPLMVGGFLGTVVSLERAVALGQRWTYAAPTLSALGALALIFGLTDLPAVLLMVLSSLGLVAVFGLILRRQPTLFHAVMGLGALAWLVGNVLWLIGWPLYRVALWWVAFLVLTIAGERLELARLLRLSRTVRLAFLAATGLFLGSLLATMVAHDPGVRLAGVGMIGLAAWLLRHDIARRTVRRPGLTRYIAMCLLSGYVWLGASGLMALLFGGVPVGPRYDATLHALFLGFVASMIFGHAPIIVPALLSLPMAFHPTFYVPLTLLHLSLLFRVVGNLVGWSVGRQWGGLLNVLVVLLFLGTIARALQKPNPTQAGTPDV